MLWFRLCLAHCLLTSCTSMRTSCRFNKCRISVNSMHAQQVPIQRMPKECQFNACKRHAHSTDAQEVSIQHIHRTCPFNRCPRIVNSTHSQDMPIQRMPNKPFNGCPKHARSMPKKCPLNASPKHAQSACPKHAQEVPIERMLEAWPLNACPKHAREVPMACPRISQGSLLRHLSTAHAVHTWLKAGSQVLKNKKYLKQNRKCALSVT